VKHRLTAGACLAFALCLLLSLTVPVVAHADTSNEAPGWPKHLVTNMTPDGMAAFGNDSMSFLNCGNQTQAESFEYVHEGVTASSLPVYNSQIGGVGCNLNNDLVTPDGTFYTDSRTVGANHIQLTFAAMKNSRTLWSTDLSSDPQCTAAGDGNDAHEATMTNPTIGSDGNIYGIVQSSHYFCATYLVGLDVTDGSVLFKRPLTTGGSIILATRLWTYASKIVVVDTTGLLREFDYSGNEDVSKRYQFPVSQSQPMGSLIATPSGRVFATGFCSGWSTNSIVRYHDEDGQTGMVDSGQSCSSMTFAPAASDDLVAVGYYGLLTKFHVTPTGITVNTINLTSPSGYITGYVGNYWQDQDGNAVITRQFYGSNYTIPEVSVDRIDATTGMITNLFLMPSDTNHSAPALHVSDVAGGYLYALVCNDSGKCLNSASTDIDGWVHKISLDGFGTPIKDSGSFVTQVVSKRSLVAMGDSYSGGEGNPPFEAMTDTSTDQCHRSAVAYPWLVANAPLLNLKLTDFTACTGATVWLMENGQNGEPAQTTALNDDTSVVTLTIGGNDVHFVEYVEACTWACGPNTTPYNNIMADIDASSFYDSLKKLYGRILIAAPNANVYVADYPLLAPQGAGSCAGFDLSGTYNVETALNDKIAAAVGEVKATNARLHFVEVNYSGSPFEEHDLCSGDASYFNGIVLPPNQIYSVHPKVAGQTAYAATFSAVIQ